jgi:magnesium-protoporphyrin O-methyltransferase
MPGFSVDIAKHNARLRAYFNGAGFERWSAIYGDAQLSAVRRAIRSGHSAMLAEAAGWLPPTVSSALDVGCGTGLFSLTLAQRGADVLAVDLAPQMVAATAAAAAAAGLSERVRSEEAAIDELAGSFDLVVCFDVLIHYPPELFVPLLRHLASLTKRTLLFTFAPATPLLAALHRIGGMFPRSERRTAIQLIPEPLVRTTLHNCGLRVGRTKRISSGFYHVALVEAMR